MKRRAVILGSMATAFLAACSNKFTAYNGPKVTFITAHKSARKLTLYHENTVLKRYNFELGFAPVGHKQIEGDGKTPEGQYFIDRKNPNSRFYLSLGISYPNRQDIAKARAMGKSPGGDIFIHGTPDKFASRGRDWTWGCLAVTNRQMRTIYAMVDVGTPIKILP